jgi:hypothetical protein
LNKEKNLCNILNIDIYDQHRSRFWFFLEIARDNIIFNASEMQ